MKVTMALAALCVALQAPCIGSESTPSNLNNRHLRHEHDSNTPLQRRDEALVPAHRVYDPVSGLACSLVGKCMVCPTSEKDESYCRETGYRQELDCPRVEDDVVHTKSVNQRTTRFRPCSFAEPARPGVAFVKFEAIVAVVLAVSVMLLRRERRKYMSAFDLRKDPRQRVGLLGASMKDST